MKKFVALMLVCLMCLSCAIAHAEYPDRPITMIIPYGAGGTTDVYGRRG